ncbi:hypothetical protein FOA52_000772 [Chlamydomonas sp. UWO 241]|nr:hypothetical protein FOA52_000772 [Chlamydomonas sp. UWO 241]
MASWEGNGDGAGAGSSGGRENAATGDDVRAALAVFEDHAERVALQGELHAAWAAGEPNVVQLKQLLLDPAVNREFERMREQLTQAQAEGQQLRRELAATGGFEQDGNLKQQLLEKVSSLATDVERLSDGKAARLEVQLGDARRINDALDQAVQELDAHASLLDAETEDLQREVMLTARRDALAMANGAAPGLAGPGGGMRAPPSGGGPGGGMRAPPGGSGGARGPPLGGARGPPSGRGPGGGMRAGPGGAGLRGPPMRGPPMRGGPMHAGGGGGGPGGQGSGLKRGPPGALGGGLKRGPGFRN